MQSAETDGHPQLAVCVRYLSIAGLLCLGFYVLTSYIHLSRWSKLLLGFSCCFLLYCAVTRRFLSAGPRVAGLLLVGFLSLAMLGSNKGFSFGLHLQLFEPGFLLGLLVPVGLLSEAYVLSAALIAFSGARPRQGRFGAVASAVVLFLCAFVAAELLKPGYWSYGQAGMLQSWVMDVIPFQLTRDEVLVRGARSICYCVLGLVCLLSFLETDDQHRTHLMLAGGVIWLVLMASGLLMVWKYVSESPMQWLGHNGVFFGLYALALMSFVSLRVSRVQT